MPGRTANLARVTLGLLNRIVDPVPGRSGTPLGPATTSQRFAGMLGAEIELDNPGALQMSDLAIGTLFGGIYKYVKIRPADLANTFKRGMVLFWDSAVDNQVTSTEALATQVGVAGIQINPTAGAFAIVPGNYSWIFIGGGKVAMANKAALTVAAAVGLQMQWSAAGAGADNGTADTLAVATTVSMAKYLGIADSLPVAGSITNVHMNLVRRRGV